MQRTKGFTIVELLIVIVVIGILAALVLNSFASVQEKAKVTKATSDVKSFARTVTAGALADGRVLQQITNNGRTMQPCVGRSEPLYTLPKTDACWTDYYASLDLIAGAIPGFNAEEYKKGDPWGSPYLIDENEGFNGADGCLLPNDWFSSAGKNGIHNSAGGGVWSGDDIGTAFRTGIKCP